MSTKASSYGGYRGIYSSPYDAFTNYMNILGDFISRVNNLYPEDVDNEQLESLFTTIKNQDQELEVKNKEIEKLPHACQVGARGSRQETSYQESACQSCEGACQEGHCREKEGGRG